MDNKEVIRIEGIDPKLKAAVKIRAIQENKTMKDFIVDTLEKEVSKPFQSITKKQKRGR